MWPKKWSLLVLVILETGGQLPAGSLPDRSISNMSNIRDPKDFSERPCVRGIQSLSCVELFLSVCNCCDFGMI